MTMSATRPTGPRASGRRYLQTLGQATVFEAGLNRMRWLFDEFDNKVAIGVSGGKDSTVVLELAAMVARERGCGPVIAWWLDQECEFQATVDYMRYLAYERDDIDLRWYQIPFRIENATNLTDKYLHAWGIGEEWVREKEPSREEGGCAIVENVYGVDHFYVLLAAIANIDLPGYALIDGIRSDESPGRRLVCTGNPVYKWVTWSVRDKNPNNRKEFLYRFHPVYDWHIADVWAAISKNDWVYNAHYDHLYQWGVSFGRMRVSNYHHEHALASLWYLQEVEPETWEAATRRLAGINTYGHLREEQIPKKVPYMFDGWVDYMNHLIDNLVPTEEGRETFRGQYQSLRDKFPHFNPEWLAKMMMRPIITGDYYGVNLKNWMTAWSAKDWDHAMPPDALSEARGR